MQMPSLCSGPYFGISVWQKMLINRELYTSRAVAKGSPASLPTHSCCHHWYRRLGLEPPSSGVLLQRRSLFYRSSSDSYCVENRCQNVTASIYSGWRSSFVSCFINIWNILEHFHCTKYFQEEWKRRKFPSHSQDIQPPQGCSSSHCSFFQSLGNSVHKHSALPNLFVCFELLWTVLSDIMQQELLYRTTAGQEANRQFPSVSCILSVRFLFSCRMSSGSVNSWSHLCVRYVSYVHLVFEESAFQWIPFSLALSLYPSAFYLFFFFFFSSVRWLGVNVKE